MGDHKVLSGEFLLLSEENSKMYLSENVSVSYRKQLEEASCFSRDVHETQYIYLKKNELFYYMCITVDLVHFDFHNFMFVSMYICMKHHLIMCLCLWCTLWNVCWLICHFVKCLMYFRLYLCIGTFHAIFTTPYKMVNRPWGMFVYVQLSKFSVYVNKFLFSH